MYDISKEYVVEMVRQALEPVYKSRGIETNLNNEPEPVKKESSEHYLHGIL